MLLKRAKKRIKFCFESKIFFDDVDDFFCRVFFVKKFFMKFLKELVFDCKEKQKQNSASNENQA